MKYKMFSYLTCYYQWLFSLQRMVCSIKRTEALSEWIYEMHNAGLNLCHGLKIYKQKTIFYCVLLRSCIVAIRFCP